jgi:hypothetical protein
MMAVVTRLKPKPTSPKSLQPTEVELLYGVFEHEGQKVLQLDTVGSEHRAKPGKQSQTLQLTHDTAKQLCDLLQREFQF